MNNILWKTIDKNGKTINEDDIDFFKLDKKDLIVFSLINNTNNGHYTINLKTGQFSLNGMPFSFSIQKGVLDIPIENREFNYAETLFWYNEMYCDFNIINKTQNNYCANVFIGYKIPLNIPHKIKNGIVGKIIQARPMLKIDAKTNKVSISNKLTFIYKENGQNITIAL